MPQLKMENIVFQRCRIAGLGDDIPCCYNLIDCNRKRIEVRVKTKVVVPVVQDNKTSIRLVPAGIHHNSVVDGMDRCPLGHMNGDTVVFKPCAELSVSNPPESLGDSPFHREG